MKKVVVTGASRGIGLAVAERFAKEGYALAICARNQQELEKAAAALQNANKEARTIFQSCDVSDKKSLKAFFDFVYSEMGTPDILVNNAGIFYPGQIHNEEEGVFEKQIATNLASAYHLTRLFLPGMITRRSGHIFNMCSTASITAYVNGGSYCISKFGLYGMTKVLREELKVYGIKVTSVLPGAVLTASWKGTGEPKERFIQSEDVAEMIYSASILSPGADVEEILIRPSKGDIN